MFDTIVLRVHDLNKYERLVRVLDKKKDRGFKLKTFSADPEEYKKFTRIQPDLKKRFDVMELTRTGEYLVKTQVSKQVSVSHHYAFTYRIDMTQDYIEFNFSIPKYAYGSNVIMFVEHYFDQYYKGYECSLLEYNIKRAPARLISFIKHFLKVEFILDNIDMRDVEVNRIDVSFNQVFKTKEDALAYFNYQKKITKKHSREADGGKTDWKTSFMYSTKRSSSKIYHKGTEYRKHDYKEHAKINNEKGYQYFDTKKIQELADRILRYEVTIRSAEMNYLFKHNIFRRNCPFFKIDYKNYMRIGNTIKRNERIAKKMSELPESEKKEFKLLYPYERISPEDRKHYKYVSHLMERKPYFTMGVDEGVEIYNKETVKYECGFALFSEELIALCLRKLLRFMKEYKITELPNEEKVGMLIDEYNRNNKIKLQKSDMMRVYLQLVQYGTFKEVAKVAGYSRATYYRYKDKFKRIGITENNAHANTEASIPNPPLDLQQYHMYVFYSNILKGIKRI